MEHSNITRLVTAGFIGAGAGLFIGNRIVKTYDWRTEWFIPTPLPVVYEAMTSREALTAVFTKVDPPCWATALEEDSREPQAIRVARRHVLNEGDQY